MSKKGGEGGVIANPKNFIANLRILFLFSGKKRNVISEKGQGGGGKAVWKFSKKNIHIWGDGHPLVTTRNPSTKKYIIVINVIT